MQNQIKDYLQTQAFSIDCNEVAVAQAATQMVLMNAQAHIDASLLCYAGQPESLMDKLHIIKQLFIALDATYSRQPVQTAVLYGRLPECGRLIRLAQIGKPIENELAIDSDSIAQYLAARTAHSGWANRVENAATWLNMNELQGQHNRRAISQTSLPICGEDGVVHGVLHLEAQAKLSDDELANWIGLVLGVLPTMREYFAYEIQPEIDQ